MDYKEYEELLIRLDERVSAIQSQVKGLNAKLWGLIVVILGVILRGVI